MNASDGVRRQRIAILMHMIGQGGPERMRCNLARAFLDAGFSVDFVLLEGRNSRLQDVPAGASVVDLHTSRRAFHGLPAVVRYLRRERPDAVLSAVYPRNLLALWARSITRIPVRIVGSEHNTPSMAAASRPRMKLLAPYLVRWTYPLADGIVAISEGVADDLARWAGLPRESITVIYNPVIGPGFEELAATPIAHPWFETGEVPVVLGAGRLSLEKDFPTLIRAFAHLRKSRAARLVILGEGRDRPRLEQLVHQLGLEGEVALPGFTSNPFAWMARASVFVLSSVREGLSNVLIEALACGCPVVSTDCPNGPAEILEGGRYGRLVPVGDVEAMAHSIADTLDNPLDRDALKARGREFTIARSAARYLELLGFGSGGTQGAPRDQMHCVVDAGRAVEIRCLDR